MHLGSGRHGMSRLLYLGFAFRPGGQGLHPGINPAGHAFETQMGGALARQFELRSVGVLPVVVDEAAAARNLSPGLNHDLVLLEKRPELFHRWRSLARLKRQFSEWRTAGWIPDAVLVYNLSPIYNAFLRWLRRQPQCPRLILLLADSPQLGEPVRWSKKLRHRFKPLTYPDAEMTALFDGCIALSRPTERWFEKLKIPWLWMPGGCEPGKAPPTDSAPNEGDIVFGYFGALAPHTGVMPMLESFLAMPIPNRLRLCGHGNLGSEVEDLARNNSRVTFGGLLPSQDDCLAFGQTCDVLINPRPCGWGNENNFPSKIFQYALTSRAILSTRLSGVEIVLGPEAFYFDEHDFGAALRRAVTEIAGLPRAELRRRGGILNERITSQFSWTQQAAAMAAFIRQLL
ncbi:MAG: glycosyltransferase [Opitutaceae bacterium]|nr:glycosyltransferase [Verrucomicrobiales bacterium]